MSPLRRGEHRVTVDEAHRRVQDAGAPAVLLDVREQDEWDAGHAPGAVHTPLSRLAAGAALPDAAHERALVVICRSGTRSRQAAELLAGRGAEGDTGRGAGRGAGPVDVMGGMKAWAAAGLPVVDAHGNPGSIA
ncbi:rhodanese-like domain-containing protein [Streptomyces sp. DSM 118148]|uniref:rhodanese-like domain-containing protein n=1 Tax=Streptomyces sp. DSM 118148 TaxID=3448667 RepID=UPI0040401DC2